MNARTMLRTAATAAAIGVMALASPTGNAFAEAKKPPKQEPQMCTLPGDITSSSNDIEFYVPGDTAVVYGPNMTVSHWECQEDGTWDEMEMTRPRSPGRLPGGVFTQAP